MSKLIKIPFLYAIAISVFFSTITGVVLLDAFVLSSAGIVIDEIPLICDGDGNTNVTKDIETSDTTYTETASSTTVYKSIKINIETYEGATVYIADIQLSSVSFLRTAFAKDTYGRNIREYTSTMAENNNAVLAINGDFYGYRSAGLVIRNGVLYRDVKRAAPDTRSLLIDKDGNLEIFEEGSETGQQLIDRGVFQAWSFGPVLVENSELSPSVSNQNWVSSSRNPRVGIGQIGPLHYLFIVVDGRSTISRGLTLVQFSQLFKDKGAITAYNLDGGGSATIWFNGKVINKPTYDGAGVYERGVSDIVYIIGDTK
jgi:exopolysaccharide biosynthesis protein